MNLCEYVKDGSVVFVKIHERDINKRSKIVSMPKCQEPNFNKKKESH
jgi:hypothetical protein